MLRTAREAGSLASYKFVSAQMSLIDFDKVAKLVPHDPKLRDFFKMIGSGVLTAGPGNTAQHLQLFVSPLAWAYFTAYHAIVFGAWLQVKILEIGVDEADEFFNLNYVKDLLKSVLPHHAPYIDANTSAAPIKSSTRSKRAYLPSYGACWKARSRMMRAWNNRQR